MQRSHRGQARTNHIQIVIVWILQPDFLYEIAAFGPGAHERHFPFKDIHQLWKFVKMMLAQELAYFCQALIISLRQLRLTITFLIGTHCPEFQNIERFSFIADSLLLKKNTTIALPKQHNCNYKKNRGQYY